MQHPLEVGMDQNGLFLLVVTEHLQRTVPAVVVAVSALVPNGLVVRVVLVPLTDLVVWVVLVPLTNPSGNTRSQGFGLMGECVEIVL